MFFIGFHAFDDIKNIILVTGSWKDVKWTRILLYLIRSIIIQITRKYYIEPNQERYKWLKTIGEHADWSRGHIQAILIATGLMEHLFDEAKLVKIYFSESLTFHRYFLES
jgi:hypothetical protein